MRCPLCDVSMKEVERRGVLIDVCPECRGVWLDRGELDKLLATAERYEGERHWEEEARAGRGWKPEHDREREYRDDKEYPDREWGKRKKRRGLLGEIFDFDFFD